MNGAQNIQPVYWSVTCRHCRKSEQWMSLEGVRGANSIPKCRKCIARTDKLAKAFEAAARPIPDIHPNTVFP